MEEISSPQQRRLTSMFFIFSLSSSFLSVFLPAYYVIIGSGSFGWAITFLAVQFVLLAIIPSVILRFLPVRFEPLLLASFPFYMLYYVLLLLKANPVLTGAVAGVALALFWPPFQTITIRIARQDRIASTFTILWLFVSSTAAVVGPVAGGIVISFGGGFAAALSISTGLYLVAFLSMWRFRFEPVAYTGRPVELGGPPRLRYFMIAVLVWGATDISWLAFPLFALSIAGSFVNLGVIVSVIGFITATAGIWISRVSDRLRNRFSLWLVGAVATAAAFFALGFVRNIPELLAVSAISGVAAPVTGPILIGWFHENYTKESNAPFWARFELFLNPGRLVNLGLAALLLPVGNYLGYFVVSGALALLTIPVLLVFKLKGEAQGGMKSLLMHEPQL